MTNSQGDYIQQFMLYSYKGQKSLNSTLDLSKAEYLHFYYEAHSSSSNDFGWTGAYIELTSKSYRTANIAFN